MALAALLAACRADAPTPKLSDREVLVIFYNATGGPNWRDSTNWLSDKPIDEWRGVTTGANGRVTSLGLPGNALSGEIPAELGNLSNLVWLGLSSNELSGEIPAALGNLSNLKEVWLSGNQFEGCVPAGLLRALPYINRMDVANVILISVPPPPHDLYELGLPFCDARG